MLPSLLISNTMFALILLAVLSVISTVTGDDSTSDDPTSTIAVKTSPVIPSYSCISPKSSPVYDLDDTVSFVWISTGCLGGGYFCSFVMWWDTGRSARPLGYPSSGGVTFVLEDLITITNAEQTTPTSWVIQTATVFP